MSAETAPKTAVGVASLNGSGGLCSRGTWAHRVGARVIIRRPEPGASWFRLPHLPFRGLLTCRYCGRNRRNVHIRTLRCENIVPVGQRGTHP